MSRLDTLLWDSATDSGGSVEPLSVLVGMTDRIPHEPVTVATVIADGAAPLDALDTGAVNVERRTAGLVSMMRVPGDTPFVVSAWPTAHEGVFHLVSTVPTTDARWRKVERWIGHAAPTLVPCFLDHDDFTDVGTALSEFGDVEVSRLTARRRSDMSSLTRGWKARSRTLRPTHLDAISEVDREGASVRTLTLQVSRDDDPVLSVHLRRVAGATFYGGQFRVFDDVVLSRLALAAHRRAELMTGRVRRVAEPLPQPITIRLPSQVFTNAEATGDVLAELERDTRLAVAVLHRNPYLHVVVTDYTDGSNFDVLVTATDAIDVYPGFRASVGAYTRLTQSLGERFEAVEIAEAEPLPPLSLDDLISTD